MKISTRAKQRLPAVIPAQASSDGECVRLWLHRASPRTKSAYRMELERFRKRVRKPLKEVAVGDVLRFASSLPGAPASKARALASIKSLLSFAFQIGYILTDLSRMVRNPRTPRRISERLLTEDEVHRVIGAASTPRDALIMKTLYYTGLRCSELCDLTWKNVREGEKGKGASLTVLGKGGLTRTVNISQDLWDELKTYRREGDVPLFASRKGSGRLTRSRVHRIVQVAAENAGIQRHVFPHAFRHSHATHAIEHGAPLHLVQQTLGHSNLSTTGVYLHAKPNESSGVYLSR